MSACGEEVGGSRLEETVTPVGCRMRRLKEPTMRNGRCETPASVGKVGVSPVSGR
jgi:hypothetical protein